MSIVFSVFDQAQTYGGRKQFDCGHAVINKFVHDSLASQVKRQLSVAYVLTDSDQHDQFVGFFTIAHHAIDATKLSTLQLGSLPRQIPCCAVRWPRSRVAGCTPPRKSRVKFRRSPSNIVFAIQ